MKYRSWQRTSGEIMPWTNVNSYGKNLDNPMTFAQLLEEVEKIDGIERIRFMTSHPKDLSDELARSWPGLKDMPSLHLPLQFGSSDSEGYEPALYQGAVSGFGERIKRQCLASH